MLNNDFQLIFSNSLFLEST